MSSNDKIHLEFPGRILLVGFGSIGQGVLPLILRHIGIAPERLTIVTAEDKGNEEAARYGIKFVKERLTRENYRRVLKPLLGRGDFLINVSVEVASVALIKLCWKRARCTWIPASSPGRAATPTQPSPPPAAPITRCARRRWRCAPAMSALPPRCSLTAPTQAWCRTSRSRRC